MKKWMAVIFCILLMAGCSSNRDYETIGNVWENTNAVYLPAEMELILPEKGDMKETASMDGIKYYQFGNCQVWMEVQQTGNISASLEVLTGQNPEYLTVITREIDEYECHETTWSTVAEEGIQIGRALIADDGKYHYCIALLMPENESSNASEVMEQLLQCVQITDTVQ